MDDVEPIEEIVAELVRPNALERICPDRGHESHIAAVCHLALDELQQLQLHRQSDLLDFLDEESAVVRLDGASNVSLWVFVPDDAPGEVLIADPALN